MIVVIKGQEWEKDEIHKPFVWGQKWEPGIYISWVLHPGHPAIPGVTSSLLCVTLHTPQRCLMEREERLTTTSVGSTLDISGSCRATWLPHPGTHVLWGSSMWWTDWFWGSRRDQPIAEWWQNKTPTCRRNGNKSFTRTKHWMHDCLQFCLSLCYVRASQVGLVVKNPPASAGD